MEAMNRPIVRPEHTAALSTLLCLLIASTCTASTIHQAAGKGNLALLKSLLKSNPSCVNAKDERNVTPLHIAAYYGQVQTAKALINAHASVDAPSKNGNTPLHWAIWRKHTDIARLLIDAGADVNATTKVRRTPLHFAAENGDRELAELLIERGARQDIADSGGKFPADLAKTSKNVGIISLLVHTENPPAQRPKSATPLDIADDPIKAEAIPPTPPILPRPDGPQDVSVQPSEPLVVITEETLSPSKKDSTLVSSPTPRPTTKERAKPAPTGRATATPLKTPHIFRPLPKIRPVTAKDLRQMIDAALAHDLGSARKLIAAIPRIVDARDQKGATPLHWAAQSGDENIATLLIRAGADVNARKPNGVTPIQVAAALGNDSLVRLLAGSKADIHAKDCSGRTALSLTRERGRPDTEQLLLDLGAVD